MRFTAVIFAPLLLSTLGTACHSTNTCTTTSECPSGSECLNGTCATLGADSGPECGASGTSCASASDCLTNYCASGCCAPKPCTLDTDCGQGEVCVSGACQTGIGPTGCTSDSACSGATPHCELDGGACVACIADSDCDDSREECTSANTCAYSLGYCSHDSECALLSAAPACNATIHACVSCVVNTDCPTGDVCTPANECVAAPATPCTTDSNCTASTTLPHCDPNSGVCVECTSTSQCAVNNTCYRGTCVEGSGGCTTDSGCTISSAASHCATDTGMCVECVNYSDCPIGKACVQQSCQAMTGGPCTSNANCTTTSFPECDVTLGVCVECLASQFVSPCAPGTTCANDLCVFGCSSFTKCETACGSSGPCEDQCLANTTETGRNLFQALDECIYATACPDGPGDVCDSSAANYNSAVCLTCAQAAKANGGRCATQSQACAGD